MSKNHLKILSIFSLIYILILGTLSLLKYYNLLYNQLDLAIFTNVLYNLKESFSLYSSIQGHSYLEDHITPILLLLVPLFTIVPHAITLLTIQTITLAGTSFVVYYLVKTFLSTKLDKAQLNTSIYHKLPLVIASLWLINPLIWNTNLFEFHIIIFAPIFIFLAFIFYWQNKFTPFILSLLGACLVREDIALIVLMISIIAWIDKKPWKYRVAPFVIGILYFGFAFWLLNQNADGNFRFFIYYSWLGESISEIIKNLFLHPSLWIKHILSLGTIEMLVGLLFPFLLLPLKKPKYLLLSLFPLGQFLFTQSGGSNFIVQTHYSMLFVPALTLASLDGLISILKNKKSKINKAIYFDITITKIIFPIFFILVLALISPLYSIMKDFDYIKNNQQKNTIIKQIAKTIPNDASIVTTYKILPYISNRKNISSLHYIFLGNQQFSTAPYTIKEKPEYILMDTDNLNMFNIQNSKVAELYPKNFHDGINNIQKLLYDYTPTFYPKNIILWTQNNDSNKKQPFPLEVFPLATTKLQCYSTENTSSYTISCSTIEPKDAVYLLDVDNDLIPFIWRKYDNNYQEVYARFFIKKNQPNNKLFIKIITQEGYFDFGPWLNAVGHEKNREVIQETIISL